MGFPKILECDQCRNSFTLFDEKFPEDLYDLIMKYKIDQLYWICKICIAKKDQPLNSLLTLTNEVKENTALLKDIKSDLQLIKNLQYSKTFDLSKIDNSGQFDDSGVQDTDFSDSVSSTTTAPCSPKTSLSSTNLGARRILEQKLQLLKPNESELKRSKEIVRLFLNSFIKELKEDQVFNCLYNKPYYTGSSYSDLRIISGTEYDIDLMLKLPEQIELKVEFLKETDAFAKLKWKLVKELPESKKSVEKLLDKSSENDLDSDYRYILPGKINAWFQSVISKCQNKFPIKDHIPEISEVNCYESGPARTFKLNTLDGLCICIDLVPVFVFDHSIFPNGNVTNLLNRYNLDRDKQICIFVPKKLMEGSLHCSTKDKERAWKLDLPELEIEILSRKACAKPVIKLMKLLRDNLDWKHIASYYIKTIILIEIINHPDNDYWEMSNVYNRFLETLEILKNYLDAEYLPMFYTDTYNLIYKLNEDQCRNWYFKLQSIIKDITSDYNKLKKHLRT